VGGLPVRTVDEEVPMHLHGSIGDAIIVDGVHQKDPPRRGEIVEVIGTGDAEHFRVRWDDGHTSLFFPGATTRIVPLNHSAPVHDAG
jgi:hypothetical protein